MRDVLKAHDSNFAKRQKDVTHTFEIHYRSKKRGSPDSISLLGKHVKISPVDGREIFIFPTMFGDAPLICCEPLPICPMPYDLRLIREHTGKWYLSVPLPLIHVYPEIRPLAAINPVNPEPKVVALDPGVRTFLTGYSPEGELFEVGTAEDMEVLFRACERIDQLQSLGDLRAPEPTHRLFNAKTRRHMKKRAHKLRAKVKNLRSELHHKTCKLLCAEYDTILLPTFEVSNMVAHTSKRVLRNTTVRKMLTWSHHTFQQLLIAKAREVPSIQVILAGTRSSDVPTVSCALTGISTRPEISCSGITITCV